MRRSTTCPPVLLQFATVRRWTTTHGHAFFAYKRSNSSQSKTTDSKAFSKTLLLPKTSFPLRVDPLKGETQYQKRSGEDLYRWQVRLLFFSHILMNNVVTSGIMQQAHCSCCTMDHLMRMVTFIWVCLLLFSGIGCVNEHN
jgi:hypothetical protein